MSTTRHDNRTDRAEFVPELDRSVVQCSDRHRSGTDIDGWDVVEQTQAGTTGDSDYEAVGGGPAIASVVEVFYRNVLADPQLSGYFADTDLARLKRHQVQLVSQVMGGPVTYEGPTLADA